MNDITQQVGDLHNEVTALRLQTDADGRNIALLKQQYDEQSAEFTRMRNYYEERILILISERDVAERKRQEVHGILNTACTQLMQGLRKMRGDEETTTETNDRPPGQVDHDKLPKIALNGPPITDEKGLVDGINAVVAGAASSRDATRNGSSVQTR